MTLIEDTSRAEEHVSGRSESACLIRTACCRSLPGRGRNERETTRVGAGALSGVEVALARHEVAEKALASLKARHPIFCAAGDPGPRLHLAPFGKAPGPRGPFRAREALFGPERPFSGPLGPRGPVCGGAANTVLCSLGVQLKTFAFCVQVGPWGYVFQRYSCVC